MLQGFYFIYKKVERVSNLIIKNEVSLIYTYLSHIMIGQHHRLVVSIIRRFFDKYGDREGIFWRKSIFLRISQNGPTEIFILAL